MTLDRRSVSRQRKADAFRQAQPVASVRAVRAESMIGESRRSAPTVVSRVAGRRSFPLPQVRSRAEWGGRRRASVAYSREPRPPPRQSSESAA
ncbi:hypothetical protein RHECNPAF_2940036 [Rhizobium etli CNPAF512]|nr:hypothetical protein RHECNPAF_2940036 [Rhizobium etli CNPAF512]